MWRRIVRFVLILCGLAVVIGAEYWDSAPIRFGLLASVRDAIVATFRAADTQWMAVTCLTVYLFGFVYLSQSAKRQVSSGKRERLRLVCLIVFVGTALVWYGLEYRQAASAQVPVLIGGMMLGQGVAFWQQWRQRKGDGQGIAPQVVSALVLLLALGALWQPETARSHRYWTEVRWKGLWDNPNVYGMLMAVGLVLALGLAFRNAQPALQSRKTRNPAPPETQPGGQPEKCALECENNNDPKIERPTRPLVAGLLAGTWAIAAGLIGFGMLKSYSRGAWLAAVVGVGFLVWQIRAHRISGSCATEPVGKRRATPPDKRSAPPSPWITRRFWRPAALVVVALLTFAYWQWRDTEQPLMRRVFSSFNPNDFSWRNRVTTWEGALQIIADHPWCGVGWEQPLRYYEAFYKPGRLPDGRALWSNDFLMLGMTLGLPALACFVGYVALSLTGTPPKPTDPLWPSRASISLGVICRGGALASLVGFWFDGGPNGGLFTLATGATFWILLELGRER
ncbi:MAG: O-antigen ligase family protein [Verrucomicrobiae bacterium]|nr:O-antigen ligase family protein [Verrucomicrobiae bacterium]